MTCDETKVTGAGADSGTADAGMLSEADVVRLTDETAKSLLDKEELKAETATWVRRGRVIREYVRKLQPRGKFKKPDPYALLSAHPDIRWSANQLRAFVDALELWEQLGEGQPDLPVTFYALVASSELGIDEKKAILAKAVEQHLSTRALKGALAEAGSDGEDAGSQEQEGAEGSAAAKLTGDWKKVQNYAEKLNGELSAVALSGMVNLEVISKLAEVAERIKAVIDSFSKGDGK